MTKKIDFDFYSIDEKCQINDFDSWVLSLFAQNKKTKYTYFLEQGNVETALNYLKQEGKIVKTQDKTSNLWVLK